MKARDLGRVSAFVGALMPAAAGAQAPGTISREAELPNVEAIERGAQGRASVSFGAPTVPAPEHTVKRIQADAEGPTGIYGFDSGGLDEPPPAVVPEQHVVKKGDTLWSLCDQYFRDPWRWPKLWAENPQVTNPHWIFPGDVLRLRAPGGAPAPTPRTGGSPAISSNRQGSLDSKAVVLREIGFIEADALAKTAEISGSKEEKILLASGDQAYLSFPKEKPLRAGERYTVYAADKENPVRGPDGKVLGYLVRIYGDVTVDQVTDKQIARGTLREMVEPVERGYGVSAHVQQWKRIEPRPATVTLDARVVAAFTPATMLAAENFVVLSRGSKDGVQVGNRSFVVRRSDGYRPLMETWPQQDERFPKEVVGELWIVDVRETAAVAWVARSTKEIRVGEIAELRRGH